MKEYRCEKLEGKICPRSCHILNGRKAYCKDFMVIELDQEGEKNKIDEILKKLYLEPRIQK